MNSYHGNWVKCVILGNSAAAPDEEIEKTADKRDKRNRYKPDKFIIAAKLESQNIKQASQPYQEYNANHGCNCCLTRRYFMYEKNSAVLSLHNNIFRSGLLTGRFPLILDHFACRRVYP